MITFPLSPGYYSQPNQHLLTWRREQAESLAESRYDEASEAALAGNPKRAAWCEHWAALALRGAA